MKKNELGLGLRSQHFPDLNRGDIAIPWFEAISENYMRVGGYPRYMLEKIRETHAVALHGVGMSIASPEKVDPVYLQNLKKLVDEINPQFVTDHLSWTRTDGWSSHDLLPFLYTEKNLKNIADKVLSVQDTLKRPMALENPSIYLKLEGHEMSESQFLRELTRLTNCQILLDVNNLIVNFHNVGLELHKYFADIQNCNVVQFHIAGHSIEEQIRIDTHDAHPCDDAIELLKLAREKWPNAWPLLEWDEKIPTLSAINEIRLGIEGRTCPKMNLKTLEM